MTGIDWWLAVTIMLVVLCNAPLGMASDRLWKAVAKCVAGIHARFLEYQK